MKKFLIRTLAGIVILITGLVIFIFLTWEKTFDAPMPALKASTDSAVIARGKYLAFGPAHCATCHVPMDKIAEVDAGMEIPLSGGWELDIPPGTFRAPNLTPDMETGIGKFSDGQLARALRHAVKHDGSMLFPFMPFQEMCDDDVVALISFLRSQPAVKHDMKKTELKFLGKALMAFGVMKPDKPKSTPPKTITPDTTAAYGAYLANTVANCVGCHTDRDLKTGKFTGKPLAGGFKMPADDFSQGYSFITPNLTPDMETGKIAKWDQEQFVNRFHSGRVYKGSPMPWGFFSRINDTELKALYAYISTVQPVANKIEKSVFEPGEKLPE